MHWTMTALLVAAYASVELRELFAKGSEPREALKALHFAFGLSVLALIWLRLALRLVGSYPRIEPEAPAWTKPLAKLTHATLYALMIALPLLGWCALSAAGKPASYFSLDLPALLQTDKALAKQIKNAHEALAGMGAVLVGLHVLGACYHHYFRQDNALVRMLVRPRR